MFRRRVFVFLVSFFVSTAFFGQNPADVDALAAEAMALEREGGLAPALERWNRVVENRPANAEARIRRGQVLFKLARIDSLYVEAKLDERDIHEVLGKETGEIAFVSQPQFTFPVRIEEIIPAAVPGDEGNVFLVRCRFEEEPADWWRPGMSGVCKLNVEKRSLGWVFTHRTVDFLRMLFWW